MNVKCIQKGIEYIEKWPLIFTFLFRYNMVVMPPTSKKLEGHIASGTFVRASVRASVRYAF